MLGTLSCFGTRRCKPPGKMEFVNILKGFVYTLVKAHSVTGQQDLNVALQEAVTAYNGDINEMGVTPAQAALGRQPRMVGDVLGDVGQRLAEHWADR